MSTDLPRMPYPVLHVATTIASSRSPVGVVEAACRAAVDVLGVGYGGVLWLDDAGREGVVRAEFPAIGSMGATLRPAGDRAGTPPFQSAEPLCFADTSDSEAAEALGELAGTLSRLQVRSAVLVPIVSGGRPLAALALGSVQDSRAFTLDDLQVCKELAATAALALAAIRLRDVAQTRARQLDQLGDATLHIAAARDEQALRHTLVADAVRVLGARDAGYYVFDADLQQLKLTDEFLPATRIGTILRAGDGMAGRIAAGQVSSLIVADYATWPDKAQAYGASPSFGSVLSVAARCQDRLLGVLWVENEAHHDFTADDARVLALLAGQAAAGIRALHLRERLALLASANRELIRGDNLQAGLRNLAEMMARYLQHTFCRLSLFDESGGYLVAKAAYAMPRAVNLHWEPRLGHPVPVSERRDLLRELTSGAPTVTVANDPTFCASLESLSDELALPSPLRSLLVVPLRLGNSSIGVMEVGEVRSPERSRFSSDTIEFVRVAAADSVILIDRLRRAEAQERRRGLLASLDEATRQVRGLKDVSKLTREIPGIAANLLGVPVALLYVNHPHLGRLQIETVCGCAEDAVGRTVDHDTLVGRVAHSGETQTVVAEPGDITGVRLLEVPHGGAWRGIAVPLKEAGVVTRVLVVLGEPVPLDPAVDSEILARFALAATQSLETSRLLDPDKRHASRLAILHQISYYIQGAHDLQKILHVVLTGVTAGYGLGFNRAALFLRRFPDSRELVGRMAIGHIERADAEADWAQHADKRLEDFARYRLALEADGWPLTPLGQQVEGLRLEIDDHDEIGAVLATCQPRWYASGERARLPDMLIKVIKPAQWMAIVPVAIRGRSLGVIVADNKFSNAPITEDDIEALMTLANTAAIAIDGVALLTERERVLRHLQMVEAASATAAKVTLLADRHTSLNAIVSETLSAMECDAVVLFTYNPVAELLDHPPYMAGVNFPDRAAAGDGVSQRSLAYSILESESPRIVENVALEEDFRDRRFARDEGIGACIALPLRAHDDVVGLMFINYRAPREFGDDEIGRALLFSNHAAVAIRNSQLYEKARRGTRQLAALLNATKALANSRQSGRQEILNAIVKHAVFSLVHHDPDRRALSTLHLLDRNGGRMRLVAAYPPDRFERIRDRLGSGIALSVPGRRSGVIGRTVAQRSGQVVGDVRGDPDYIESDPAVRSEITAPLEDAGQLIGVLNVETYEADAFDQAGLRVLGGLAALAVAAIRRRSQKA